MAGNGKLVTAAAPHRAQSGVKSEGAAPTLGQWRLAISGREGVALPRWGTSVAGRGRGVTHYSPGDLTRPPTPR